MAASVDVRWFEPDETRHENIRTAFGAQIRFLPESFMNGDRTREETGEAFLSAAEAASLIDGVTQELRELLIGTRQTKPAPAISFSFRSPSALVHARRLERFGDYQAEGPALQLARATSSGFVWVAS